MYLLQRYKYHLEHHLFNIDFTLLEIEDRKIVLPQIKMFICGTT